jgi:hypothetical protein
MKTPEQIFREHTNRIHAEQGDAPLDDKEWNSKESQDVVRGVVAAMEEYADQFRASVKTDNAVHFTPVTDEGGERKTAEEILSNTHGFQDDGFGKCFEQAEAVSAMHEFSAQENKALIAEIEKMRMEHEQWDKHSLCEIVKERDLIRSQLSDLKKENGELRGAIQAALNIRDLWVAPNSKVKVEHEGECQALANMESSLRKALTTNTKTT